MLASYEEKGRCHKMQSARHENMRSESRREPAISRDVGLALRSASRAPCSSSRASHDKDPASHILDLKNAASTTNGTHHLLVLDIDDPASGGPLLTVPEAQALSDLLRMAKATREKPRAHLPQEVTRVGLLKR